MKKGAKVGGILHPKGRRGKINLAFNVASLLHYVRGIKFDSYDFDYILTYYQLLVALKYRPQPYRTKHQGTVKELLT